MQGSRPTVMLVHSSSDPSFCFLSFTSTFKYRGIQQYTGSCCLHRAEPLFSLMALLLVHFVPQHLFIFGHCWLTSNGSL